MNVFAGRATVALPITLATALATTALGVRHIFATALAWAVGFDMSEALAIVAPRALGAGVHQTRAYSLRMSGAYATMAIQYLSSSIAFALAAFAQSVEVPAAGIISRLIVATARRLISAKCNRLNVRMATIRISHGDDAAEERPPVSTPLTSILAGAIGPNVLSR